MKLCIDSAGDTALLVLGWGTELLGFHEVIPQHNTDRIALFLEGLHQLLEAHQVSITELHSVSVVTEPGRFTGIRLGMAMAQGLVQSSKTQLVTIKRETAYASLMHAPHGLFLCESGKKQAFGGYWQNGICAPLQLWSSQDCNASHVLSLLSKTALQKQYPNLCNANISIDYPTLSHRADALLAQNNNTATKK